jgi:hypothetical protein
VSVCVWGEEVCGEEGRSSLHDDPESLTELPVEELKVGMNRKLLLLRCIKEDYGHRRRFHHHWTPSFLSVSASLTH